MLRDGDYVPNGGGGLRRVSGQEALLQRVMFLLTARRGTFPFLENLGSRLWQLGLLPARERQGAAVQYVAEALEGQDLTVESVTLQPLPGGGTRLTAALSRRGETVTASLELTGL